MVPLAVAGAHMWPEGKAGVRKHGVNEDCMLTAGSGITTIRFLHEIRGVTGTA